MPRIFQTNVGIGKFAVTVKSVTEGSQQVVIVLGMAAVTGTVIIRYAVFN